MREAILGAIMLCRVGAGASSPNAAIWVHAYSIERKVAAKYSIPRRRRETVDRDSPGASRDVNGTARGSGDSRGPAN